MIADLGCGDAALARELVPKELTVLSFDLVSDGAFVVEADICAKIPLPGSEGAEGQKSEGEGHIVDVVVCALSLMGTTGHLVYARHGVYSNQGAWDLRYFQNIIC